MNNEQYIAERLYVIIIVALNKYIKYGMASTNDLVQLGSDRNFIFSFFLYILNLLYIKQLFKSSSIVNGR